MGSSLPTPNLGPAVAQTAACALYGQVQTSPSRKGSFALRRTNVSFEKASRLICQCRVLRPETRYSGESRWLARQAGDAHRRRHEPPRPSGRDVMDAAGGATEPQVVACLRYLYRDRGLRPGTKHGPSDFSWFKTVVADYFAELHDRDLVTGAKDPACRFKIDNRRCN